MVPFLRIDSFQIPDNGRMELGKFITCICYELIEGLFREKFAGIEVMGRFQRFPGGFGCPLWTSV